jgi:hypothetical protein
MKATCFSKTSGGVQGATWQYFPEYRPRFPHIFLILFLSSWTSCCLSALGILLHFPATRCQHVIDAVYFYMKPVVSIATSYGLDDRGVGVRWGQEFSLLHVVQTGSGVHPTSYPMATGGSFPRGVKLTTDFQLVPRSRKCGSIHLLPHTPSWRSA